MSTFLVSFGVVAATIAAVLYVALSGPDQPPTIRRQPPGARRERKRAEAAERAAARAAQAARRADVDGPLEPAQHGRATGPGPAPVAAGASGGAFATAGAQPVGPLGPAQGSPALALPDSDAMRLRVLPAQPTTLWVRVRSGVALVVLVAVLGALLAMVVGGVIIGLAFLIRSATG